MERAIEDQKRKVLAEINRAYCDAPNFGNAMLQRILANLEIQTGLLLEIRNQLCNDSSTKLPVPRIYF